MVTEVTTKITNLRFQSISASKLQVFGLWEVSALQRCKFTNSIFLYFCSTDKKFDVLT